MIINDMYRDAGWNEAARLRKEITRLRFYVAVVLVGALVVAPTLCMFMMELNRRAAASTVPHSFPPVEGSAAPASNNAASVQADGRRGLTKSNSPANQSRRRSEPRNKIRRQRKGEAVRPAAAEIVRTAPAADIYQQAVEYRMRVSAYCPCKKCCGKKPNHPAYGITASGLPVSANQGRFVAAPADIRFGTSVSVPGYWNGQSVPVLDRGGAIKGDRLDVFFPTHQAALNWGVQYLDVKIIKIGLARKMENLR